MRPKTDCRRLLLFKKCRCNCKCNTPSGGPQPCSPAKVGAGLKGHPLPFRGKLRSLVAPPRMNSSPSRACPIRSRLIDRQSKNLKVAATLDSAVVARLSSWVAKLRQTFNRPNMILMRLRRRLLRLSYRAPLPLPAGEAERSVVGFRRVQAAKVSARCRRESAKTVSLGSGPIDLAFAA